MIYIFITSLLFFSLHLYLYNSNYKRYICNDNSKSLKNSKIIFYLISGTKNFILFIVFFYNYLNTDHVNVNRVTYESTIITTCLNIYSGSSLYDIYVYTFHREFKTDIFIHHFFSILSSVLIMYYNSHIYYVGSLLLLNINTGFLDILFYLEYFPERNKPHIYIFGICYIITYILFRLIHIPYIMYIHYLDFNQFKENNNVSLYYIAFYILLIFYSLQLFWSYKIYKKTIRTLTNSP